MRQTDTHMQFNYSSLPPAHEIAWLDDVAKSMQSRLLAIWVHQRAPPLSSSGPSHRTTLRRCCAYGKHFSYYIRGL